MPANYKRTSHRASYSQEDVKIAVARVRRKELTNIEASRLYGIPASTLSDRVRQKTGQKSFSLGRPLIIPPEMEKSLADCLRIIEKWGWGLSRSEVLDLVQRFVQKNGLVTPFRDDRPGKDWFIGFRKRHGLSIKKPQPVEYLRKKMTDPFIINEYFSLLEDTLTKLKLDDPHRIWNLDETAVCLDPTKTKVVGGVGAPCVRTTAGSGRENITVLAAINAAGKKLNPLVIFKGKNVYEQWMTKPKPEHDFELAYAATKRGWIETETFYNYMSKVLIPSLGQERPVLIIYDGHTTHLDVKVVALAVENDITILKLPAHTSHLLQPLDLAVFKSFKTTWDMMLVQWQRNNVGGKIQKQKFAELFADAWHQTSSNVIQSGFKKGGIYPFNPTVIPKEKFDPNAYKRWTHYMSKQSAEPLTKLCLAVINKFMTDASPDSNNQNITVQPTVSFEQLLLQKVTQQPRTESNKTMHKLKRVAKGAEVITHTSLEQQKVTEISNYQETDNTKKSEPNVGKKRKIDKKGKQTPKSENKKRGSNTSDTEIAGPSGLQEKNRNRKPRKLKNTTDTTTILTEHNKNTNIGYQTAKGKGKGKKSQTGKENVTSNREQKKSETTQKPSKKKKSSCSIATTPESTVISLRSESDIDSLPDAFFNENYDKNMFEQLTREQEIEKIVKEIHEAEKILTPGDNKKQKMDGSISLESPEQNSKSCQIISCPSQDNKKVTILSSIRFAPENRPFCLTSAPEARSSHSNVPLNPIDKSFDIFTSHKKRKNSTKGNSDSQRKKQKHTAFDKQSNQNTEIYVIDERDDEKMFKMFKVGDTVLCRYHTKGWKYYVGVIESVNSNSQKYTIWFYKHIVKNDFVKFVIPKRKDQDFLPVSNVVKTIELLQFNENPVECTLMNDEDSCYF